MLNEKLLRYWEIKKRQIDIEKYIISCGVNHSPEDWTGYYENVKSLFSHLNEKYLRDLQNGDAILLIDQSFEGYQTEWLWDWFHKELSIWEIPADRIIYATGNMIADKTYDEFCKVNNINEKMCIIPYAHFELDMAMECYRKGETENPLHSFNDNLNYKLENINQIKIN